MKQSNHKNIARRKKKIDKRLDRRHYSNQTQPMLKGGNVQYEMSGRQAGVAYGGVAAIHEMVKRLGLPETINQRLPILKVHLPYLESDHILSLAYNVFSGGTGLEDLERLRQDEAFLNQLGAQRLPDPTTAGDFLRRFNQEQIIELMEIMNDTREKVWQQKAASAPAFFDEAVIEVDGTIIPTLGECKEGMDISYKGLWGYAPLVVTLANTREVLSIINRPGNTPSSKDSAQWIERAINRVSKYFKKVTVRGDTDFSLTHYLDQWDGKVEFILGYDAQPKLIDLAEGLENQAWSPLERPVKYTVKTRPRMRPTNHKEASIHERGFENLRRLSEDVAEYDYNPGACGQSYRMVVLLKNISVEKGESVFLPEIRYFFYITNSMAKSKEEIVDAANDRCDQENIIAQLKSGIHAFMRRSIIL